MNIQGVYEIGEYILIFGNSGTFLGTLGYSINIVNTLYRT